MDNSEILKMIDAIRLLDPIEQEIFVRRYIRGESAKLIADDLHYPQDVLNRRLRKIRFKLRDISQLDLLYKSPITIDAHVSIRLDDFYHRPLTPTLLKNELSPFIQAIFDIQAMIDELKGKTKITYEILSIRKGSIDVSLTGGKEAVELIREVATKERREHAAKAREQELELQQITIERQKTELASERARAAKDRAEAKKTEAEARLIEEQASREKAETQKIYYDMALDMVNKLAPNATDAEKLKYALHLLGSARAVLKSGFAISDE